MSDKEQIENIVQLYIDSMDESDPDKVKQAFHSNGKVVGYLHGDFMQMSTDDFADFVASQQPPPKEKGENVVFEILASEVEGTTAFVKVRDSYLWFTFFLSFFFFNDYGKWEIYTKLFNVESE